MDKYIRNDDYMLREIAGEAVLVPIGEETKIQNAMINLNETCTFLWKAFEEPHTIEEVVDMVLKEYEGPVDIITRDVTGFVVQGLPMELILKAE